MLFDLGFMEKFGGTSLKNKTSLAEMIKRPELDYEKLTKIDYGRPELSEHIKTQIKVQIKYEGYIDRQEQQIKRFKKLENRRLVRDMDYASIGGLRLEAVEKFNRIKPESVGQTSRISDVSPADINVLLIYLEKLRRMRG